MSDRQYAEPLIIRGLTNETLGGEPAHLRRISLQGNEGVHSQFNEEWFQDLLYRFPSLLPAAEIEPAFESLEPIAKELRVAGKSVDLLFMNADGYIALVETKLFRNPEARREVIAQTIDYACDMCGWTYSELVQAVKKATKSTDEDPLLSQFRRTDDDTSFNENEFVETIAKNLRKGRFLLLIVGDAVTAEAERMVEFIQRTPHLHFTLGLVELALFHEKEGSLDPLFVQPRIVAKTQLHPRIVIDIGLADGLHMKTRVNQQESSTAATRSTISAEKFFEDVKKTSPAAFELVEWALEHARAHQLRIDWGAAGPSLKYEDSRGTEFNFGQLRKDATLNVTYFLPRFTSLGLPTDIAFEYLDKIIGLVPNSYRKEVGFQHEIKTQVIFYGNGNDLLPLEKLAPFKEQWFEAIDKVIEGIRKVRGKD
jgi:hypothetical protein